jgi:hypothetical protein
MRPNELVAGNCYFRVAYYDSDLLLPIVDTLIYVGFKIPPEDGETWLFKEPESPPDPEDPNATPEPEPLSALSDDELHGVLDFEALIRMLAAIAQDHPLRAAPVESIVPAGDAEFATLSERVAEFLENEELRSVTITIRFTDDGFSLSRSDREITMGFFTHPRLDPTEDSKILSLFSSVGCAALQDRLSDRGRTRHLEFAIP